MTPSEEAVAEIIADREGWTLHASLPLARAVITELPDHGYSVTELQLIREAIEISRRLFVVRDLIENAAQEGHYTLDGLLQELRGVIR